jgi:voltage-gated sodium channel
MEVHGWAWAFFVPFIPLTSFTVLNLFIGIIVDAMQRQHEAEVEAEHEDARADVAKILKEVRALREEVRSLRSENRPD